MKLSLTLKSQTQVDLGLWFDREGLILSCAHLFKDAHDEILVRSPDGTKSRAKLLAACPDLDIAMLKIESHSNNELKVAERTSQALSLDNGVSSGIPWKIE